MLSPVAQAVAAESGGGGLSINDIYKRTYQGVVDLTVTSSTGSSQFFGGGSQQAEGSGFVYDNDGHIVTNQHVVGDGGSIKVDVLERRHLRRDARRLPTPRPTSP